MEGEDHVRSHVVTPPLHEPRLKPQTPRRRAPMPADHALDHPIPLPIKSLQRHPSLLPLSSSPRPLFTDHVLNPFSFIYLPHLLRNPSSQLNATTKLIISLLIQKDLDVGKAGIIFVNCIVVKIKRNLTLFKIIFVFFNKFNVIFYFNKALLVLLRQEKMHRSNRYRTIE